MTDIVERLRAPTDRELLEQALEALDFYVMQGGSVGVKAVETITAIERKVRG